MMGCHMSEFIAGESRSQATLFPERLDDYIAEDNAIRVVDVFIDGINLSDMGIKGHNTYIIELCIESPDIYNLSVPFVPRYL